MQLDYPDILLSFWYNTLSPCLVLNSQMPQLMLAIGDVAGGVVGVGVELLPPQPRHTYPITEKSALGKGYRRHQSRKKDATDRKQRPKVNSPCNLKAKGWGIFFFQSLINEYFLEISLWH